MAFDPTATVQDSSNFEDSLKIRYAATVVSILNRKTILLGRLEKTRAFWNGKEHRQPIQFVSGNATGARPEGGSIPSARPLTDVQSVINNKSHYCTVKVTGQVEAKSASKEGAWASVKARQIMNAAADLRSTLNRAMYGDGNGILCEMASVSGSGTTGDPWVVTIKGYNDGTTLLNDSGWAWTTTKHLKRGMHVVWGAYDVGAAGGTFFLTAGAPLGRGDGYVSEVVTASPFTQFKLVGGTTAVAPVAGDVFVMGDLIAYGKHSFGQECMGLRGIVNTDEFQSIDPATHPEWQAQILQNPNAAGTPRQITDTLLQEAYDRMSDLTIGECDMIIGHTTTRNAYVTHLKSKGLERYAATQLKGGWSTVTFNGGRGNADIYADKDAPYRTVYALNTKAIKAYTIKTFAWDTTGGGVWKWPDDEDAMVAFGKTYLNIGTTNRISQVRIEDVAVSGIYN